MVFTLLTEVVVIQMWIFIIEIRKLSVKEPLTGYRICLKLAILLGLEKIFRANLVAFCRVSFLYISDRLETEIWASARASVRVETKIWAGVRVEIQEAVDVGTGVSLLLIKVVEVFSALRQVRDPTIWAGWVDFEGKLFLFFQMSWLTR